MNLDAVVRKLTRGEFNYIWQSINVSWNNGDKDWKKRRIHFLSDILATVVVVGSYKIPSTFPYVPE